MQATQWLETDTQRLVDVTAPDNVLVSGRLQHGAVVSVHVAAIPWASSGFRMESYGRKGTLVALAARVPSWCLSVSMAPRPVRTVCTTS